MLSKAPLKQWRVIVFFFVLGTAYIGLIEFLFYTHQQAMRHHVQQRAEEELSLIRYKLEATILADAYAAKSLSMLISVHAQSISWLWENMASQTLNQGTFIRSVAISPNDVIRYVYPLEGNQKSLGTDFRRIPKQWATVKKARDLQEVIVTSPVNLIQGGRAVIIRSPVFLDPPQNEEYWGTVSVLIDIEKLFDFLNLSSLAQKFRVAIRSSDSDASKGEVFWGSPEVFEQVFAHEKFYFPSGSWQIAVAELHGSVSSQYPWYQFYLVRLIGYALFLVLVVSFWAIYRLYEKSNRLSMCDELTQLPNRRYFMELLSRKFHLEKNKEKAGSDVAAPGLALLCIDINKFKRINDQFGHLTGDCVLIECANRIRKSVRESDCVARIGGDEFLVLLAGNETPDTMQHVIERIHRTFHISPVYCDDHEIYIKVSIGYTLYQHDMKHVSDMIKFADRKMYAEKYQC